MAYTYNIPVTVRGGRRAVWDGYWDGSGAYSEQVVGIIGGAWYQSSMMFDMSSVSGKTITGITLKLTVASGTIPPDGTQNYPICDKADSSTTSWKRSSTEPVNGKYIRNQTVGGGTINASNTVLSIDMGTTLPTYGYVAGPRASSLSSSYKNVKLASTATLAVTTNETYREFTLAYNANGGSGAPGSQIAGAIQVNPSCTFTISSVVPTRTGYTFLGWSTSSSASSASYVGGNSITVTTAGTTTLYAVWRINTYTVYYNKGSDGSGTNTTDTKTYNVALTLKGAIFTRTGYAQTGWATYDGGAQAYALGGSYTANASVTLYPAWTATRSTVSTTDGTLGTQQTITITRYSDSFTHTLTGQYGNYSWTIATGVGASYAWTPGVDLAAQFPAATRGLCTITCITYSGTTYIGSSTTTCYLSIPSSVRCTVGTVTVTEAVAGLASQFGAFIQGHSKATISAEINSGSGSPAYGATVSSYAITTNGQTLTSNGATTGILNTSGPNSYSFKITDTRGYSDTKTDTYTVLAYSSPTISAWIGRDASDASVIDISYSYTISPCNDRNTKGLYVKYRIVGGSYTTIAITASSYSGDGTYQITGLDANTAYEVVVTVADYFTSTSTTTNIQPTGNRVFDISDDDKTIARHGTNYSDGWDHQYFNEQFHGVLDVTQRRCYATLSSQGWYRVMNVNNNSTNSSKFAIATIVDINIGTVFWNINNGTHKISLHGVFNNPAFVGEESRSNYMLIDKVRYTYDTSGNGHIDIHYIGTSNNTVWCSLAVHTPYIYQQLFVADNFTGVAASPSDETVLTEHTFSDNTITDISSSFALNTSGISGLSGQIHAIYDASAGLVHLNFSAYTESSTFGASTPIITCSNSKYIPKATAYGNGMIRLNSGEWYPFEVGISTTGNIFQNLTATATRVYGQITYPV